MTTTAERARILVVDDDPGMLRAVSRSLERRHDVAGAASCAEAIARAHTFRPEVAVVDIRMPEMDGFELLRRLSGEHPDVDVILMTGDLAEGDANLIRAIDEGAFYFIQKPFDRRVLQTLIGRCVELRRLREDRQRHLQRMERELAEARRFQLGLLPPARQTIDGVSISARYIACHELAGDFYDYARIDEGRVALVVADVSGHGASAAMMTGIVKSAFHGAPGDDFAPLAIVQRVSDGLREFDAGRFVTLFCAVVDRARSAITWVSAGHPPAIVHRPGARSRQLDSTGPLISPAFRDLPWEERTEALAPGDRVVAYTDGLVDAVGAEGGRFGHARLVAAIEAEREDGDGLLDGVLRALGAFTGPRPQHDDVTLLTVSVAAPRRQIVSPMRNNRT